MTDIGQPMERLDVGRQTIAMPSILLEQIEGSTTRRKNTAINSSRRFSIVSSAAAPSINEYRPQERIPPASAEFQHFLVKPDDVYDEPINERRLSVISEGNYSLDLDDDDTLINRSSPGRRYKQPNCQALFILEPIVVGFFLLPVLVLFWECGWNMTWFVLNKFNQASPSRGSHPIDQEDFVHYPIYVLLGGYFIAQLLLLVLYLCQDVLYYFLTRRNRFIQLIVLKFHVFILASIYVVQWVMLWTIWDQYTPHEWYFELVLSFASLFGLIVLIGHLSDLVCAPFLVSYDSIEYCIQFGCPLLTRQMPAWKINLLNYFLYEVLISNISVMVWRGFYHILDERLYPDNNDKSAWVCLIAGYALYLPLMYFQRYFEYLNLKFEFWTFISINFPQLYRNVRHLFAFFSCVFLWRGIWLFYDSYIDLFETEMYTYGLLYLASFLFLALIQTSSSINGPLSNMEDENQFFPLYPNCYVSKVVRAISRTRCFK